MFETYIKVNRWQYDSSRGISINTKNPMKARDRTVLPKETINLDGVAEGARHVHGSSVKSSRLLKKKLVTSKNDDEVVVVVPVSTKERKKKRKKETPQSSSKKNLPPKWDCKHCDILSASVNKHRGMALNGGIAWVMVEKETGFDKVV